MHTNMTISSNNHEHISGNDMSTISRQFTAATVLPGWPLASQQSAQT
jgi:hypothetical protein